MSIALVESQEDKVYFFGSLQEELAASAASWAVQPALDFFDMDVAASLGNPEVRQVRSWLSGIVVEVNSLDLVFPILNIDIPFGVLLFPPLAVQRPVVLRLRAKPDIPASDSPPQDSIAHFFLNAYRLVAHFCYD